MPLCVLRVKAFQALTQRTQSTQRGAEKTGETPAPPAQPGGTPQDPFKGQAAGAGSQAAGQATAAVPSAEVTGLRAQLAEQGTRIKALEEELGVANRRAESTIAAQGVPLEALPAAGVSGAPGAQAESAWKRYNRLLGENPRAAGEFWAQASAEILGSRS